MAFCFLKTEEEASSAIVWSRDQNDGKQAKHQANVRHFELSRKRIAARMRTSCTCQCMSHFVYDLRSRPLVRNLPACVRGQIASDHCRSDLITGRTQWARAGYPFPEVNLPEYRLSLFFWPVSCSLSLSLSLSLSILLVPAWPRCARQDLTPRSFAKSVRFHHEHTPCSH